MAAIISDEDINYILNSDNSDSDEDFVPAGEDINSSGKLNYELFLPKSVEKKLEQKHSDHLQNAESARQSLRNDREKSKTSADIMYTATFDLQKALPFPRLTVSEAYYRRNMYVYNLGINEVATNQAFMYVWDETLASRGSQEISSCLDKHIRQRQKKHVIL